MKRKIELLLAFLLLSISCAFAQKLTVKGTVLDETGQTIIGATIKEKGVETNGTATDMDGRFTLTVNQGATILVSYVGYKTQEVKAAPQLTIKMVPDSEMLDEVVVTGYGVTSKKAFTGAAQVIDSKQVTKVTAADPMQSLVGKVAGFQVSNITGSPGQYNPVNIRGLGSMNSGNQPLYVIDGVPVTTGEFGMRANEGATINPLANLNSNDILSVSVLKDAAATSIYGARAANGVIVITTKQGREGKTKVSFTAKGGVSMMPSFHHYDQLSTAEWMDFIGIMAVNSGDLQAGYTESQLIDFIKSPDAMDVPWFDKNINTNWRDEVTRPGLTQDYNISLSGGTDKYTFFVSGGYYDEVGTVIGKDLERYSGRLNVSAEVLPKLEFMLNASVGYTHMNGGTGGGYFSDPLTFSSMMMPFEPVKNADGEWNMDNMQGANPVARQSYLGDRNEAWQIKSQIIPSLRLTLGDFTLMSKYGIDFYNIREFGRWSMYGNDGANVKILGEEGNTYTTLTTWTNTINYLKTFDSVHHLNVLLGQEAQKATENNAYMSSQNYPIPDMFTLENGAKKTSASTSIANYSLLSFFSNLEYDYDNKYYLSASLREDGSSRVGRDNRWGTFWSVGGKYRIIAEDYMEAARDWLSNMTIRASYGTSGNQEIAWYAAQGTYRFGYDYKGQPGMAPYRIDNPNLGWEKMGKFNVGLELGIMERFNIDVDFYNNMTTDMIFDVPITRATGFTSTKKNMGGMQNMGVELILNAKPIVTDDFTWDITLNLAHNKNKITALSTDRPIEGGIWIREAGRPYRTWKMKEWAGVDPDTGEQLYYKGTEGTETTTNIDEAGKRYLGDADPDVFGGLTNSFSFFGVDLSFMLGYSFGGSSYNDSGRYDENMKSYFSNTVRYVYDNMWRQKGDIAVVPKVSSMTSNAASSYYLMDNSYIKLKSFELGYSIPEKYTREVGLSNARIYFTGDNLVTWAVGKNFRGYEPEGAYNGFVWWNYPIPRKFMLGVTFGIN